MDCDVLLKTPIQLPLLNTLTCTYLLRRAVTCRVTIDFEAAPSKPSAQSAAELLLRIRVAMIVTEVPELRCASVHSPFVRYVNLRLSSIYTAMCAHSKQSNYLKLARAVPERNQVLAGDVGRAHDPTAAWTRSTCDIRDSRRNPPFGQVAGRHDVEGHSG